MPRMSSEEKLDYSMKLMALVLGLAVKSVKAEWGQQGIARLKRRFFDSGKKLGRAEKKRLKLKRGDARSYDPVVGEALKAFNIRHKVTKLTPQNYKLRLYDCPHGENFRNAGAPPEVCDVFLGLDEGIVKSLNPKLEFALTKHILRGDRYCEYVIRPVKFVEA